MSTTTLSEAYSDNPTQLHHIIPLDFHSVEAVPDTHTWPDESNDHHGLSAGVTIPIVDLMDANVVQHVGHACQTWGVFQLTNHGLSSTLLEAAVSQARRLFILPPHQKLKALRSPCGATGYGAARISPFFSKFMWHEGFTIMGSSADEHARALWPHAYAPFCEVMDEYQKKMKALAHRLLLMILEFLDFPIEEMKWAASIVVDEPQGALQLNSYPSCPDPDRAIGLAPHTDSLLLTLLHQSDTDGLQIFRPEAGWVSVSPVTGALVVNVGDLLHILSNARFPTVYHRAVVNRSGHRISLAYFYGPPADSLVAPLSKLQHPLYRSLTVKEYLSMKAMHFEKALSMIRNI